MIKKIALWLITGVVVVSSTAVGYAWLSSVLSKSQSLNIKVNAPEDLEISLVSVFGDGTLTPIDGNSVTFLDKNGKETTAYYGENLKCTFEGSKTLYFDGVTSSKELGKALRVAINRQFYAPEGFTKGIMVNNLATSPSTTGVIGCFKNSADLNVTIFLEGQDEACIRENLVDDLDVTLNFHVE